MKRTLCIAAAVAACGIGLSLPAIAHEGSEKIVSLKGESGGIIVAGNFGTFLANQPEGVGNIVVLIDAHGMFDNLFGARPEGGDGRGRIDEILHVMIPIDPFKGLRPEHGDKMQTLSTENGMIAPDDGNAIIKRTTEMDFIDTYVDKVKAQLNAGNYPLEWSVDLHRSMGTDTV
ncbi:hypothetical protein A2419_01100 [Candidatus Adlerbacteria bacterium RIFOXYC1_FULL_48_26]|uniref:Uncharacterized protein n=1 Tax=Candidatus Adlerbacteria bacterium RIFOXYC1_FULL_48_26 TaxID=1797247 RepID=A0A1F4Y6P9_9BACT|nr:MAG: hypothetical protein A2419_01100 [Candidatus Adlerbacteria bacterium RIFOXYC1_FULL_48_26]OGC94230.1 MAG: hypothetical protein A2389_03230 [Candidatus Adlerbacteria bacterium RIFOXYB1_FULL_48_10]OGC95139.1 MAG: hypothetical protein A2590_01720 [Candidatus Adlerbacteria bacterium RIFOXYD1_FULL_48_8]